MAMPRVALYIRVSTEDQARDGFSLSAQRERLEAYCLAKDGWEVVEVYRDDGYSGRDTNRPAYRRMLDEMDRWDVLLVLKMDRIHRNSKNFMVMMEQLESEGKEFASAMESLDTTTAMGRFVVDIIQRIAQLESEQIGERVHIGMKQKAQQGGQLGGHAPYGYERDEEGDLVVVPEQAEAVERIYRAYLDGATLRGIAAGLRDDGVPTANGGTWRARTVSKILNRPTYAGYRAWDGVVVPADHEPIVDPGTFDAVQRRLAQRSAGETGRARPVLAEVGDGP